MEGTQTKEESLTVNLNRVDWEAVFRAFKILTLLSSDNDSDRAGYDEWIRHRRKTTEFEIAMRLLFARFFVMESIVPADVAPEGREKFRRLLNKL